VKTRIDRAFNILAAAPEEHILVAAHGYLITYIGSYLVEKNIKNLRRLKGRAWVPNCSVTKVIAHDDGSLELVYFGRDDYDKIS
jgi:broad specificity phosphatase PhoE